GGVSAEGTVRVARARKRSCRQAGQSFAQPRLRRGVAKDGRGRQGGQSCVSSERHAVCGSNTSRRLSPRKLNASTAVKIASPGNVPIHQNRKYCVPVATIDPHPGCGGW